MVSVISIIGAVIILTTLFYYLRKKKGKLFFNRQIDRNARKYRFKEIDFKTEWDVPKERDWSEGDD